MEAIMATKKIVRATASKKTVPRTEKREPIPIRVKPKEKILTAYGYKQALLRTKKG